MNTNHDAKTGEFTFGGQAVGKSTYHRLEQARHLKAASVARRAWVKIKADKAAGKPPNTKALKRRQKRADDKAAKAAVAKAEVKPGTQAGREAKRLQNIKDFLAAKDAA